MVRFTQRRFVGRGVADMQKVEILPPADYQVKFSAKGQNQTSLHGFMNFHQFTEIVR